MPIITLTTRRHDGILLSIASLFSRRGFALSGLYSRPAGQALRVVIETPEIERLERVIAQLAALPDVLAIEPGGGDFARQKLRSPLSAGAVEL